MTAVGPPVSVIDFGTGISHWELPSWPEILARREYFGLRDDRSWTAAREKGYRHGTEQIRARARSR